MHSFVHVWLVGAIYTVNKMHAQKKSWSGSSEVYQRASPANPRSNRLSKSSGSESDSAASANHPTKFSTNRSPKVNVHQLHRSSPPEKKRGSRMADLECQLALLQEDLKKNKVQLDSSESWKRRAQQKAEEAKKEQLIISTNVEDSQCQLVELSAAEDARFQELRKVSQERDHARQPELETIQKQRSIDSAALTSATNEIHRLKLQLDMFIKSEAAQAKKYEITHSELLALKQGMADTVSIAENLKIQLRDSKRAEAEAQAMAIETKQQLEMVRDCADTLCSDGLKLLESISSLTSELEESRAQVNSLEEVVKKLQADLLSCGTPALLDHHGDCVKHPQEFGCHSLEFEVEQLKSALEAAEIEYLEEQIKNTVQIHSAYELVEHLRIESALREADLESLLKDIKMEIVELKVNLFDRERELRNISDVNKKLDEEKGQINQMLSELGLKLTQSISDISELKAKLLDKETARQRILEENELLKLEMENKEKESYKNYAAAIVEVEQARANEQEALRRLQFLAEEEDKSSKRAGSLAEQLDAVAAAKSEMEAEFRRMRVQSDQWRKAAEAAAAVLTTGNDGKFAEMTSSLDSKYHSVAGKLMSSPFSDDLDDESPKKKNNNVLLRIGTLLKKSQK